MPEGFIECRAIDSGRKKVVGWDFVPAGDMPRIRAFLQRYSQVDIYYGVVSRRNGNDGTAKGCGKPLARRTLPRAYLRVFKKT